MTDCSATIMCETHDFHNFLDTSTLVTKKLYGLHMISRGMHTLEKNCHFLHVVTCVSLYDYDNEAGPVQQFSRF